LEHTVSEPDICPIEMPAASITKSLQIDIRFFEQSGVGKVTYEMPMVGVPNEGY
jgi:hypothetical protein